MTKKLVLAVLSVVAVFAALGTTTYAWFTLTGEATIDDITVNIEGAEGLEISVLGANVGFRNSISTNDVVNAIKANPAYSAVPGIGTWTFATPKLTAVTPLAPLGPTTTFTTLTPALYETGDTLAVQKTKMLGAAVANVDYIEFSLWVRVAGGGQAYWVNPVDGSGTPDKSLLVTSTGRTWVSDYDFAFGASGSVGAGKFYRAFGANAARVSIDSVVVEKDAAAIGTQTGDTVANSITYGNNVTNDGSALALTTGGLAYVMLKHPGSLTGLFADMAYDGTDGLLAPSFTDLANAAVPALTTLGTWDNTTVAGWNVSSELKVRIWLEGWDLECFDSIFSDALTVSLRFATSKS